MTTQTGFKQDTYGSYIDKDPAAVLVYSLDWNDWIETNETVANSVMAVSTISGDPNAMTIKSSGFTGNVTYAELQAGSAGNVYTVTNTITTTDGAVDARRFRVKVLNRNL
jgi:hypothetical protein